MNTTSKNTRQSYKQRALLLGALLAAPLLLQSPAHAEIAQLPLYVSQGVPPNIMFTIDDSGSMQFEVMPASSISNQGDINYMYPDTPADTYNTNVYGDTTPTFENDPVNAYLRSSHNNKIYYNPAVSYQPWSKSNGGLWDNADPTAAYWNPANQSAGSYNLLQQDEQEENWAYKGNDNIDPIDVDDDTYTLNFWPMVYWVYKGSGSVYDTDSYDKIEFRTTSKTPYINDVASTMAQVNAITGQSRTADEAVQNFANWFQYYRSRALLAKAGIGRAFSQQGSGLRVGFAAINELSDGNGVELGVRKFEGADRQAFFDTLYNLPIPQKGTPLRSAMSEVGQYFMDNSNDGPWSATPGTVDNRPQLACRQNYNVFMTDGYWNGPDPDNSGIDIDNEDGTDGTEIAGPNNQSFTYNAEPPFKDDYSETLADVAMYFWMTDLRPDLDNVVPTSSADPAFWQHMVSFTVGLGVFGQYTNDDLDELKAGTEEWPDPTDTENADRIDDLFHAGVNGHGDFFSASNPTEFANALSNSLLEISSRVSSAASVATNTTRLNTGAKIYQALFDSSNWSGQLKAFDIITTGPDAGNVGDEAWNAATKLLARTPDNRDIITWNPTSGKVDFIWDDLSTTQKTYLDQGDGLGDERLDWLRGSHANEVKNGGSLRNRNYVLGDIVNSDPRFVGQPDYRYFFLPGDEGTTYSSFRNSSTYKARPPMIYIGANDGMLHGFNASTGAEVFAYVPNALFENLAGLTATDYREKHRFYVDGSPRSGDAYFNNSWHTVLVGGLGAGGKALYALDITTPNNPDVLWEVTTADDPDLGYTFAQPTIVRLYDGNWYVAASNGYESTSGAAELYLINIETGAIEHTFTVDDGGNNGLSTPIPIDVNADRITDFIFAGDLQGNMWKFDLRGNNTNQWGSAFTQGQTPLPLFTAESSYTDANGDEISYTQPITHRPDVGLHPDGGYMVYFGTGQYFETGDNEVGNIPFIQTFYGVRDVGEVSETTRANLVAQTIEEELSTAEYEVRIVSENEVDYSSKRGWYMDMVSPDNGYEGERVVSRPILRGGKIIFTTLIPSGNACDFGGTSWLMELDAISGGRTPDSVFDIDGDGDIDEDDLVQILQENVVVSGVKSEVGVISTPAIISSGETETKYVSGSSGQVQTIEESGPEGTGRKSWRQLR